jgi:leader peptidase (prepilin peptidase)/N-methyltransferase
MPSPVVRCTNPAADGAACTHGPQTCHASRANWVLPLPHTAAKVAAIGSQGGSPRNPRALARGYAAITHLRSRVRPGSAGAPQRDQGLGSELAVRRTMSIVVAPLAGLILVVSLCAFPPPIATVSCLLGWTMLAIAAIDARYYIIPDVLSLPAIPAGLLASGVLSDWSPGGLVNLDNVIGAAAGAAGLWLVRALYASVRNREGLGLGDVKLASVGGAWTGWQDLPLLLLMASVLALGLIIAETILRRSTMRATTKVPFGAFLAPSIWIIWALDVYGRAA